MWSGFDDISFTHPVFDGESDLELKAKPRPAARGPKSGKQNVQNFDE